MPSQVASLISLPRLDGDGALIASLILALAAFIVGGRALLAYLALARRQRSVGARADRLAAREETLAASLAGVRARATALSVTVERVLWALPRFDARVARLEQSLADDRRLLAELRRDDGARIRRTVEGIRGTLTFLRSAAELRRKFWA